MIRQDRGFGSPHKPHQLRMAVPFSPQQSTTKVALAKATKHKANPATDEVRVENRNHGLAFLPISDFVDKRFLDNFVFGLLGESSEMIVSSSKIPALPG